MRKGTFVLEEIWEVIGDRLARPAPGSYVGGLVHGEKGIDRVLEKVGEEATEFVLAVKNGEKGRIVEEAADLQFHLLGALRAAGVELELVMEELAARRKPPLSR
jgi:phosphoribosyl-ATP pyrophosphohydrolase